MAEWNEPAPGVGPTAPAGGENWAGDLEAMMQFADGGIVSKTLVDRPKLVNISLFTMATGQTMSSHAASRPATIHVLSGEGKISIGDQTHDSKRGTFFFMPAGQPHALESTDNMVFLLYLLGVNVVDLALPLGACTPAVEGDPPVVITRARSHERDGYQVTAVCFGSHSGTHLDAPRHFFPEGATLDSYPVERLVRPGWVVDVRPEGRIPEFAAGAMPLIDADLMAERLRAAKLEPGDFLLLWTGGALLTEAAVPLLLESGAGLVGTDAPSLDDDPYPAHALLLGAGVLLAENLANLDRLGPGRVTCAFLPLSLVEADGAPVRAVAWR